MTSLKQQRLDIWLYRREFFQAAQRKVPELGRYLRRYGTCWQDAGPRREVIGAWQERFNLPYGWAFECAWSTLAMWDRYPDSRRSLEWFAAPRSRDLGEERLEQFTLRVERQFFPGLDFGWFKESIHGALEAELERFGELVDAEDLGNRRRPKHLGRAFECLALRVCKGLSPGEISKRPEYSRDWTTLSRDIKASAKVIGLHPPRPGRPSRNLAR